MLTMQLSFCVYIQKVGTGSWEEKSLPITDYGTTANIEPKAKLFSVHNYHNYLTCESSNGLCHMDGKRHRAFIVV